MGNAPTRAEWKFELLGGRLCLDFANTVSGIRGGDERDRLHDYADLVSWGRQTGAISSAQSERLLAEARRRPAHAAAAFRDAIALREAIYRLFLARVKGRAVQAADLEVLNAALARALAHRRLVPAEEPCCALAWEDVPGALDVVVWPVAVSAAELLTSGTELARVSVCGLYDEQECGWLFVDETRSHTRRWCSMKDCGNRAKARRHYQRLKGGEGPSS